jgi:RNA polymerase sigma-70 factor, ECF subfamily
MLLHHSRRDARTDATGELVLLADQDRGRWHRGEIAEAGRLLAHRRTAPAAGPYRLQALIAAEHAGAGVAERTDWTAIAGLYAVLDSLTGSPVVRLNYAVAVAERDGPEAGLALLTGLDTPLAHHHLFFATRAEFALRLGRHASALGDYDRALALARTDADRSLLTRRRAACAEAAGGTDR